MIFARPRRRRVSFLPAVESLALRITPSDVTPTLPVEPPSSDVQPPSVPPTYTTITVPPMYPPDGTPGTTPEDYF